MFFVAQAPPSPPIAAEVRTVKLPTQERLRITRPADAQFVPAPSQRHVTDAPVRSVRAQYLTPQEQVIRRAKFAGGPPDVCNGSTCALSVWRQLGENPFRDPFERP